MTIEEIRGALDRAMVLRVPERGSDDTTTTFIAALEDYLVKVARMRGDLEEARFHAYAAVEVLEDEWEAIEGWETIAGTKRATAAQKDDAKRELKPDLWGSIKTGRRLAARLTEQIKRLGSLSDDEVVSRLYTLVSGR